MGRPSPSLDFDSVRRVCRVVGIRVGEDALANLSIEKQPDGKVQGFIRIRSKAQGIALSLGDKINLHQNRPKK
jgi:hypothetical protein